MEELKKMRNELDKLDQEIISWLIKRMNIVRQIGDLKRDKHIQIQDKSREKDILSNVQGYVEHPIFKEMISEIYTKIMEESRVVQKFFQEIECSYRKVGILGCGLIGGSICKGLKAKDTGIYIGSLSQNDDDALIALKAGWLNQIYPSLKALVENSELIVLASPISTIISLAKEIKNVCSPDQHLVIIDIASVKGEIVPLFEEITSPQIEFLSTHPMAGKETRGFSNSQVTLFSGHPWIVVPHEKNSKAVISSVEQWIRFLGGEVSRMSPEDHDKKTALVSHLPGMISKALLEFVLNQDESSLKISGTGFKSMTRLAHSNPILREEILKFNRKNIKNFWQEWISFLGRN